MIPVSVKRDIPLSVRDRSSSILNGKPEERRELFDEAAGIVKYQKAKSNCPEKVRERAGKSGACQ